MGTSACGKTVFLTSLLDHLRNHDRKLLPLHDEKGQDIEVVDFKEIKRSGNKDFKTFPQQRFRSMIVEGVTWPEKTADIHHFDCLITIDKKNPKKEIKHRSKVNLEFLDVPGERFADLSMYETSYENWSDAFWEKVNQNIAIEKEAQEFLKPPENLPTEKIIRHFKVFLGKLYANHYSRMVSPSIFILDRSGKMPARGRTFEEWASERLVGTSRETEFVPLPAKWRESRPELVKEFKRHYRDYSREIVRPLVDWLKNADQLLLLIDQTEILMGGPTMYNDVASICDETIRRLTVEPTALTKALGLGEIALSVGLIRHAEISKIGVVSTKVDKILRDDENNVNLLAEDLLEKSLRRLSNVDCKYFGCAAVNSSERVKDNPQGLAAVLLNQGDDTEGSSQKMIEVSQLPDKWPDKRNWNDYYFPDFRPHFPDRTNEPPKHRGMEKIVNYILKS